MRALTASLMALSLAACGPSAPGVNADAGSGGDCTVDGSHRCLGATHQECQGGTWHDLETCTGGDVCAPDIGCADCNPAFGNACRGDDVVECNPDGTWGDVLMMCPFESCSNGACVDPCGAAAASRSYLGCEYWPVDLDNAVEVLGPELLPGLGCEIYVASAVLATLKVCWDGANAYGQCDFGDSCALAQPGTSCSTQPICVLDAQHSPFAVVVSNPDPVDPVGVTLTNSSGTTANFTVGPGAVQAIFPQMSGFTDASLDHSGIETKAYKLTSTKPIVAYQFNPLDNVGVFSNDASLLLPAHTFDTSYFVVTYPTLTRRPQTNDYSGYVTVVASAPGTTSVTVTPTAGVRAGTGVAAISAGATQTFTLNQFQTLNLEAVADGDLTGTVITADPPAGVYVGHEATVISQMNPSPCCADHLEDQLFPASTWGKVYVVAKTQNRMTPVPDLVRVTAQKPGTPVTFNPPAMGSCPTLAAGQFCDVFINADTEVSSTEPILVAHYLSSNGGTDTDSGDPAIAFAVPTEQYRTTYTILVPQQYTSNYLSLVAPATGAVMLDGADVTGQLATFGTGSYKAARISVTAGQHKLDCPDTCGVEVYGFSEAVSYLYAGGLDLEQIVVE